MLQRILIFSLLLLLFVQCNTSVNSKKKSVAVTDSFYTLPDSFASFSKSFTDSLDAYFSHDFNGTVIMTKGHKQFKKAYGYADAYRKEKMPLNGLFQLASVSKTITSVATLLLVQRKQINIDSSVKCYLKDFPYGDVTVRQLLNHRSGLANYMYFTDGYWQDTGRCMSNKDFYDFMVKHQPTPYLKPDVSFSYCNSNFAFLVVLIEEISGKSFPEFVRDHIFKPCGMRHTFFYGYKPASNQSPVMTGRFDKYVYNETYYMDGILGDKSAYSSVEDMFLFHRGLLDGRLLNKDLMAMLQTPSFGPNIYGGSYGLGFRLKLTPNGQWTYHNGWWRGFWTFFWNRFDKDICFVILTNNHSSAGQVDEVMLGQWLIDAK